MALLFFLVSAVYGETNRERLFLYVPSAEQNELKCLRLDTQIAPGQSPEEMLTSLVIQNAYENEAVLTGCYPVSGIVNMFIETRSVWDEKEKLLCAFAIWQTLSVNTDAHALNLWFNGIPVTTPNGILNTLTCEISSLSFEELYQTAMDHRLSTVYRANTNDNCIIPELVPYCEGSVRQLSEALQNDRVENSRDLPAIGYDFGISFTNDGALLYSVIGEDAADTQIAAAVMNVSTNLPDAEGILYSSGTKEDAGRSYLLTDAVNYLAAEFVLYTGETRYLPAADSGNPMAILKLICVEYLSDGDLLDAYIDGDCAVIDVSVKYYEQIQSLNEEQEHKCLFAIVNSVCKYTSANKVKITVEGKSAQGFAGNILIDSVLYPDYGM